MSIDEIIKELNKIIENLKLYKDFWESDTNEEKNKNSSTII